MVLTLEHQIQVADADNKRTTQRRINMEYRLHTCWLFGSGWRLPTKEELRGMYELLHRKGKGNFKIDAYWSNSTYTDYRAWYFNFERGDYDSSRNREN